jgi:phenylacetate-CoA ligase
MEKKYWNGKWENMAWDDPELRDFQWNGVQKQIKYCYDHSPHFYQKKFKEHGIEPGDIQTWEDFRNIPILFGKDDERKSQQESLAKEGHPFGMFLCCPPEKVIGVSTTGGTTGEPTYHLVFSQHDVETACEDQNRIWWMCGIRPGDRVANLFAQCMHATGWVYNVSLQNMGCCPVPIGAESGTERILRGLRLAKPKAIIGTAPLFEYLIERSRDVLGMPIRELGIKILVSGATPGAGIPGVRKKIEEAYGGKLFDMTAVHVSCDSKEYYGLHATSPDHWIWDHDLLDPETRKPIEIRDGVIGIGIQTFLDKEARPLLKYNLADLLQVFTKECPGCGFRGIRMKFVGRADDMLIVKGVNVFPDAVKGVVSQFFPRVTGEMRIVLDKPGPKVDPPMKIKIEHGSALSEEDKVTLAEEIRQAIRSRLEVTPVIQLVPPGDLGRDLSPTAKKKLIEKTYEK